MEEFVPGEVFVYTNGDKWELGVVKGKAYDDAYYCWYHMGDTASCTPVHCMHKLANAYFTKIDGWLEQKGTSVKALMEEFKVEW